jgi:hypothetical protein
VAGKYGAMSVTGAVKEKVLIISLMVKALLLMVR